MPYQVQAEFESRCFDTGAPKELSILSASLSFLFTLLNIPGNLLVILVIVIDPHKNLRSPFNYLMANLAFADLIVGVISDPFSVYLHWKEAVDSNITEFDVQINHMSYFISCTASVLSLATLAVERYLAIRDPHNYRNKFTGKRILLTIAGIWFLSLTLPWLYLEVGFITYAFIFANSAVGVAFFITCFTYGLMLRAFKDRSRDSENRAEYDGDNTVNEADTVSSRNADARRENAVQVEQRMTRMFLVVLLALLCCYAPSTVLIYALGFCKSCSCVTLHWFKDLQHLFVLANSSINFFCYAFRSPRFLSAIKSILRFRRSNVSHADTHM